MVPTILRELALDADLAVTAAGTATDFAASASSTPTATAAGGSAYPYVMLPSKEAAAEILMSVPRRARRGHRRLTVPS